MFGRNAELKAGDTADVIVVIGGSATALGKVRQDLVAILAEHEWWMTRWAKTQSRSWATFKLEPTPAINGDTVAVLGTSRWGQRKVLAMSLSVGGAVERREGAVIDGRSERGYAGAFKLAGRLAGALRV